MLVKEKVNVGTCRREGLGYLSKTSQSSISSVKIDGVDVAAGASSVEQLGIDDVANTYLPPQANVAQRVRRTRNIGAFLGERVGNKVGAQRNKRWRDAWLSNLA